MKSTIQCICGKHLDANAQKLGDRAQCPACGNIFVIGQPVKTTAIRTEKSSKPGHSTAIITALSAIPSIAKPTERSGPASCLIVAVVVVLSVVGLAFLGSYFFFGQLDGNSSFDEAITQTKGPLTNACQSFKRKNGRWPESLQEMLVKNQNGGPYLENRDALRDPWGNVYQYDVNGPMNNGEQPDIWTVHPKTGAKIGNWPTR